MKKLLILMSFCVGCEQPAPVIVQPAPVIVQPAPYPYGPYPYGPYGPVIVIPFGPKPCPHPHKEMP